MTRLDHTAYRWYALVTPPQRELAAERLLIRAGFATFVPTRTEWRFVNRIARMRRRKTRKTYPLMPRYVFLGMSEGTPGWHAAMSCNLVTGVIGEDRPKQVPQEPLWRLMRQFSAGRFNAPDRERFMQTHREFREGDAVVTDDGLWEGKVIAITGERARIWIELFGSGREVDVETQRLVAAQ